MIKNYSIIVMITMIGQSKGAWCEHASGIELVGFGQFIDGFHQISPLAGRRTSATRRRARSVTSVTQPAREICPVHPWF